MAPQPKDPITDYSQTQRILLLIDLNPLLHISNPTPFLDSLLSSAKTLLSFPPLSSSLFSFKTFFSSLSPLLSSSKLHPFLPSSSLSLSFNHSSFTLISLSQTLQSFHNQQAFDSSPMSPSRASCLASSMRQLMHDYAWDPVVDDSITGTLFNCSQNDSVVVGSNLVILLSPACRSKKGLSEFLNVEIDDECLQNVDVFCEKFRGIFDNVNSAFIKRGIQFSWIDVRFELEDGDCKVQFDDFQLKLGFFLSAIRSLGWGFCTTDSIILGSALVPFGLIYPKIAISSKFFNCNDCRRRLQAQLILEILDASTKPLECKCSDLEMVHLKMLARNKSNDFLFAPELQPQGCEQKNLFFGLFGDGIVKLHIKAVQRHNECAKFVGHLSDPILVHESLGHSKRNLKECSGEFFADRVLDMLAMELGEFVQRKSIPIWQILLSFLYREDCWAVVTLSNGNGDSHLGVLKPFTFSSALLSIIEDGVYPPHMVHDFGGAEVARFITKMNSEIHKSYVDKSINSQDGPSPSNKVTTLGDGKKKKKKLRMLQDLTWSAFCKKAVELLELDLGEVYFARECNNSKKLKFLKCWMKQIKKPRCCSLTLQPKYMSQQEIQKEKDDRLTKLHQEIEQPVSSSASAGENFLTEASKIQDTLDFRLETCEAFFSNLSSKIQQGLESEGVDLGALAERLVNSSIYWLYKKRGMRSPSESQNLEVKSDDACGSIVLEVTKVLLREPKELAAKHKDNIPSFQASDPGCTVFASKDVVREYEMQILFRMEILQSELGVSIGESIKQKFVKQICLLLESIQCHLEGGFFGDWSLDNYVGKIIRNRYCHTLGDIVHKIYTKMDLLLFADEDESPNTLLNSEDSNQSWREKSERDEFGENKRNNESVSAEAESLQLPENDDGSPQGIIKQTEHARRLMNAQERRERARRFASFTSWMPDLQRVWAPKQPKLMKQKSDPLRKLSKRKERRRVSYDMVCETPMTGNKRSCLRGNSIDDEDYQDSGSQSGGSVSKALFQDDS